MSDMAGFSYTLKDGRNVSFSVMLGDLDEATGGADATFGVSVDGDEKVSVVNHRMYAEGVDFTSERVVLGVLGCLMHQAQTYITKKEFDSGQLDVPPGLEGIFSDGGAFEPHISGLSVEQNEWLIQQEGMASEVKDQIQQKLDVERLFGNPLFVESLRQFIKGEGVVVRGDNDEA